MSEMKKCGSPHCNKPIGSASEFCSINCLQHFNDVEQMMLKSKSIAMQGGDIICLRIGCYKSKMKGSEFCSIECEKHEQNSRQFKSNVEDKVSQGTPDWVKDNIDQFCFELGKAGARRKEKKEFDPIEKASYYNRGTIETIDFVEDHQLGAHAATAIIYIDRAGHKPGSSELEDLKKAVWWLKRRISMLEKENSHTHKQIKIRRTHVQRTIKKINRSINNVK